MRRTTESEILQAALRQSAIDSHCDWRDFLREENVTVVSRADERARKYLQLPFDCDLVSYGSNVVASVRPELLDAVRDYLHSRPAAHCFETPALHTLDGLLRPLGLQVRHMAEYFLPETGRLTARSCGYEIRQLSPADFEALYTPQWSNALCEARRQLDVMGMGAFDGGELVGLAGASADCESMWQIGIDVLPAYRKRGIASALTSRLALAILQHGKVPFYCAAWSNIPSVRNALRSGFRPAWVELTAKRAEETA